jgi:hypothetical protein
MVGFGPPVSRQARRERWHRQIQRQHDGSLTIAEFCRRLGVSTVTFHAWKRRLREAPPAVPVVPESLDRIMFLTGERARIGWMLARSSSRYSR